MEFDPLTSSSPMDLLQNWVAAASVHPGILMAKAACLATVDPAGFPDARMILTKDIAESGVTFFTHLNSPKSQQLMVCPQATLVFYWAPVGRQIRLYGTIHRTSRQEDDPYFATRPRMSQLGAVVSHQSQPLWDWDGFMAEVQTVDRQYCHQAVPCPDHWGGFRLSPDRIEFWQEGPFRLHHRKVFTQIELGKWDYEFYYP